MIDNIIAGKCADFNGRIVIGGEEKQRLKYFCKFLFPY